MTTADDICEELGFSVSEARTAATRVERRKARVDDWNRVQISFTLPDGRSVYRFQRVVDTTAAIEFMIVGLGDEQIQVQEVGRPQQPSRSDLDDDNGDTDTDDTLYTEADYQQSVSFGPVVWLTIGQFMRHAEPQYTTDGAPVFAY